jgi:hypothetical protein
MPLESLFHRDGMPLKLYPMGVGWEAYFSGAMEKYNFEVLIVNEERTNCNSKTTFEIKNSLGVPVYPVKCLPTEMGNLFHNGGAYLTGTVKTIPCPPLEVRDLQRFAAETYTRIVS